MLMRTQHVPLFSARPRWLHARRLATTVFTFRVKIKGGWRFEKQNFGTHFEAADPCGGGKGMRRRKLRKWQFRSVDGGQSDSSVQWMEVKVTVPFSGWRSTWQFRSVDGGQSDSSVQWMEVKVTVPFSGWRSTYSQLSLYTGCLLFLN
jgi:hypothetical protein